MHYAKYKYLAEFSSEIVKMPSKKKIKKFYKRYTSLQKHIIPEVPVGER